MVRVPSSGNSLLAIACARADDCWATGYPSGAARSTNEVEHFNGHAWRLARTPTSLTGGASGISCRTLTTCWIVGVRTINGNRPTSLKLIGGAWQSVPMPSPQYPDVTLQGIDSASPSDCWAVGSNMLVGPGITRASKQVSFAEQWDGSAWQIATLAGPPAARNGFLDAPACAASDFCVAGGQASNGGPLLAISKPVG